MNTTEKDIELFDGYMDGTLSDTERTQFEERLHEDEAYMKEYELHEQIVLGIQRKELKAMLQEQEKQTDKPIEAATDIDEESYMSRKAAKRLKKQISQDDLFAAFNENDTEVHNVAKDSRKNGQRVKLFLSLAAAACFFFAVFIVHDAWKMSSLGGDYIAQLEQPVPRGSGMEETLALIYDDLQQDNYSEAQENIDKARELLHDEQIIIHGLTEEANEEILYHQQMLKIDTDELDWYQALLYAKTHKIFKAKKLLKQIAKSDSRYSEDAVAMLK